MKQIIMTKCSQVPTESVEECSQRMDGLVQTATSEYTNKSIQSSKSKLNDPFLLAEIKIAGNSTEFVNKILEVLKAGQHVNIDKVLEEF